MARADDHASLEISDHDGLLERFISLRRAKGQGVEARFSGLFIVGRVRGSRRARSPGRRDFFWLRSDVLISMAVPGSGRPRPVAARAREWGEVVLVSDIGGFVAF